MLLYQFDLANLVAVAEAARKLSIIVNGDNSIAIDPIKDKDLTRANPRPLLDEEVSLLQGVDELRCLFVLHRHLNLLDHPMVCDDNVDFTLIVLNVNPHSVKLCQ